MKKRSRIILALLCASILLSSSCGNNNKPKETSATTLANSTVTTTAFVDPNTETTTTNYTVEKQDWTGPQVTNPSSVSKYNDYVTRMIMNLKQHGINVTSDDTTAPIISMEVLPEEQAGTETSENTTYTVDNIAEYIFQSATVADVQYNADIRLTPFKKKETAQYYSVFDQWWDSTILAIEGQFGINDMTVLKLMAQYLLDNYDWIPVRHQCALNTLLHDKYIPTATMSGIYTTLVYDAMTIDSKTSETERVKQIFKYLCNLYTALAPNDIYNSAPDSGDWMLAPGYTSNTLRNMIQVKVSEWGLQNVAVSKVSFGVNTVSLPVNSYTIEKYLTDTDKKPTELEYTDIYNSFFYKNKFGTVSGLSSSLNFERSMLERSLTAMTNNANKDCKDLLQFIHDNPGGIYDLLIGIDSGAYAGVSASTEQTAEFSPIQSKYANVIASHGSTGNNWTAYTNTLQAAMATSPVYANAWSQLCKITPMGYAYGDAVTWLCTEQVTNNGEYSIQFTNGVKGTFYKPNEMDNERYSWFIQIPIRGSISETELKNVLNTYIALAGICTDEDYERSLDYAISGAIGKIAADTYSLGIDFCDDMAILTIARG